MFICMPAAFSCCLQSLMAASISCCAIPAHRRFSYDIDILTAAQHPRPYNLLDLGTNNILLLITVEISYFVYELTMCSIRLLMTNCLPSWRGRHDPFLNFGYRFIVHTLVAVEARHFKFVLQIDRIECYHTHV